MNEKSGIDELGELVQKLDELVRKLGGLLSDPHPGLHTWMQMLSEVCIDIGSYGGIGNVSAMPNLLAACKAAIQESSLINTQTGGGLSEPTRRKLESAIDKAEDAK